MKIEDRPQKTYTDEEWQNDFATMKTKVKQVVKSNQMNVIPDTRGKNERYYPIASPENSALYEKYLNEAKELNNVYFLGRLGDYKYYNMDLAIARAIELFESLN